MTSPEVNAPQRTYQTFMLQTHEGLHNGDSPLINARVGMVSQLLIDYMHLAEKIAIMKGSLSVTLIKLPKIGQNC
jgi:hypothetical protein